jgi:hypothetical protein
MLVNFPRLSITSLLRTFVVACLLAVTQLAVAAAPIVVGNARFTVITPYLIRMEYQPSGHFVDLPSIFAANRTKAFVPMTSTPLTNPGVTIATSAMTLTYLPDGRQFDATNLAVTVKLEGSTTRWEPGADDPANLGGTLRTVDGLAGPVNLGQGVLSRSGWAIVDDSQSPLLTPDGWVESRPSAQKTGQDWYFFGYGADYRAALSSLMKVSGSVPLPRKYALGVWYSRYWPWTQQDYQNIVTKYGTEGFPLDNIVLDMDWHKDGWTGWSWNTMLLPDAPALLSWFHGQGLHDTVNLHPADGVAPYEGQYSAFMKALDLNPGSQVTVPFDAGSRQYMDALFGTVLDPLKNDGVDFWWLDWQQYPYTRSIPDLTNLFWLNTLLYNYTGESGQRGMSFSRWAGWGDQRHPIHFSGDANTGFPMLAFEVPFTSTAGNVGCFFWSHDIGGHMGGRNEESYARWCQFGATSPVLRSHSTRDPLTDRVPWNYPKWAEDSMRISLHLRSELFPYIYTSAEEACVESVPFDRPTYLDLPKSEDAYHNGQEFLLGDNILVAPIATVGAGSGHVSYQSVWFPPTPSGYWYNILTGEREAERQNTVAAADINEFPIYARGGIPIPMQPYTPRMGTTQVATLQIRCYPGRISQLGKSTLYEDDGLTTQYLEGQSAHTRIVYKRLSTSARIFVSPTAGHFAGQPAQRSYILEFPDISRPVSVTVDGAPASFDYDPAKFTAVISVHSMPISHPVLVVINGYRPEGWNNLHATAAENRLTGSVSAAIPPGSPALSLKTALTDAASTAEKDAVLASSGLALVHKNISPTFYPEAYQDLLFVPYGIVDNDLVTLSDGVTTLTVPPAGIKDYPIISVAGHHVKVSFQIGGQTYYLPASANSLGSDDNVASTAAVTVSSVQQDSGSAGSGAIDGVVGGYPGDASQEWASNGENSGAWIRLDFPTAQTVDQVWLYDRPNLDDQVISGVLTFSDGTSVAVGTLPNDASKPQVVRFPSKTITWLKFTVTQASSTTQNIGLSEIAVFKAGSKAVPQ